ncbi:MAG TPA: fatty acid desaturase, partial [Polyangiaceae bacterium]
EAAISEEDFAHLRKLERWASACTVIGYATGWLAPNPLSAIALSLGSTARWTIVVHHVSHKSMDKVPGIPERYTSRVFAQGQRRMLDWFDWMLPEAWHHEHDVLHHFHTGELADPDLVEENARVVRDAKIPKILKYVAVAFYATTWKLTYYTPNTFQILKRAEKRRARRGGTEEARGDEPYLAVLDPRTDVGREFWRRCLLPYGLGRFVAIPAAFLPLGPWAAFSVWANSVAAEVLTNVHTFLIIAPNHAGDDVYRFDTPAHGRAELYVRQVAGSANYTTGGDLRDFLQGFLNYQIEHHLFPTLPPRKYQQMQPRVKALCAKYGVPYVQQSLFRRVKKLVDVMVGNTSMPHGITRAGGEHAAAAE